MTYRERPSRVAAATVWQRTADGHDSWILPDGCMDLIWDGSSIFVAGPDTGPHRASALSGTEFTAVRFGPGTAPAVLGVPALVLRDQRVPLDELWNRAEVARIVERLHCEPPAAVLENVAAQRLLVTAPDPIASEVARLAASGLPVAEIAGVVGLGTRHLHRRSLAAFGYGPKVLARILRLQRALTLARTGIPFAVTAAEAGYADQAHLAREVRMLTGASLARLVASQRSARRSGLGKHAEDVAGRERGYRSRVSALN